MLTTVFCSATLSFAIFFLVNELWDCRFRSAKWKQPCMTSFSLWQLRWLLWLRAGQTSIRLLLGSSENGLGKLSVMKQMDRAGFDWYLNGSFGGIDLMLSVCPPSSPLSLPPSFPSPSSFILWFIYLFIYFLSHLSAKAAASKGSPFKASGRSDNSRSCFAHCQEFFSF